MRLRESAFKIGRMIGKRPIASGLFCVTERALPLHRLARSRRCVAFCHPKPTYSPHVLVVPTTPFPSLAHSRMEPAKKAELLWEMIQLARDVTADHDADWRVVINGGSRQDIGQVHGHLIHDVAEPSAYSVDVHDPAEQLGGWEHILRWIEAAESIPGNGYSVTFRLLPEKKVVASFSESNAFES